jgi:hypothetical protein
MGCRKKSSDMLLAYPRWRSFVVAVQFAAIAEGPLREGVRLLPTA